MEILSQNNTFENTQTTSFLNKLDALIASGYADADDYSALIQCCLNVENAPESQRQVAGDVVNVLRTLKIELLANNSQKEFALQKFGKHLNNANLPIDIIKLLSVLFCKVFKTISADIAFKRLQEQFLNFNESDWQNFKTQYKDNAERNNFKDADFSADLHLIQNYFENSQHISANQFQQINESAKQVANDAATAFEAKSERNVVAITSEKDIADATTKEVAEPEISQATGTHGDLPTQKLASIIDNAEPTENGSATNLINDKRKGNAQKVNIMSIINENSNISNEIADLSADFPIDALQDKELIAKFNSIVSDSEKCKFFFDTFCDTYNDKQQCFNFLEIDKVDSVVFFSNNLKCIKVSEVRQILTNDFVFTNGKNVADIKGENLFVGLLSNNQGEHKLIFTDTNGTNYSYGNAKNCYFQVYNQPLQNVIVVKNITEAIIANSYFMDRIKFGDCSFEIVIIYDDFIATIENIADNIDNCKLFAFCHANNATLQVKEISNIYFITENLKHTFLSLLEDCDNNDAIKQVYYTELAKYISDVIDNAITDKERPQIEYVKLQRWNDNDSAFNEPFPLNDFPQIVQEIVKANPRTPPALTALTAITIFATAIQGFYNLKSFKDGGFSTLPTNISTFILAPSSAGKSSTLKLLTESIDRAQEFWKNERIRKLAEAEQTKTALEKEKNKKEPNEHTISVLKNNLNEIKAETPPQNIFHFNGTATSEAVKDIAEVNKNLLFSNAEAGSTFNSRSENETIKFLTDRCQIHDGFLPSHYTKTNGCNESTNVRASQVLMMQPTTFKNFGDDFLQLLVKQGLLARAFFDCVYNFNKPPLNPDILPSEKDTENEFIKLFNNIIYKLLTTYKIDVKDNILFPKYELTFSNDCYKFYCEKDAEIIKLDKEKNSIELAIVGKLLENAQRLAPTLHLIDLITNELQSDFGKKYGVAFGFNLERYSKIQISLDCLKRAYNIAKYCVKSQMFYFGGGKNYEQNSDDYKLKIEVVKKLFSSRRFKNEPKATAAVLANIVASSKRKNFQSVKKADIERIMPYLQMKGVFIPNDEETIKSRGYVYSVNPAIYEFENFDAFAKEMRLFAK